MIFYHGTSKENWEKIQEEGVLFGRRYIVDNDDNIIQEVSRCTYLATEFDEAKQYGDIVLSVEYEPLDEQGKHKRDKHGPVNNYDPDGWQLRVYEPIPLSSIQCVWNKSES